MQYLIFIGFVEFDFNASRRFYYLGFCYLYKKDIEQACLDFSKSSELGN